MVNSFYRMTDPEPDHGTLTITIKGIGEYDVERIVNYMEEAPWSAWTTIDVRFKRVVRTDWTNVVLANTLDNENW